MPAIPAILNAAYDAIGVRIFELPLKPERVYQAIKQYNQKLAKQGAEEMSSAKRDGNLCTKDAQAIDISSQKMNVKGK